MPLIETERCLCGKLLHYAKPAHYKFIADQVRELGPDFPLRPLAKRGKGYWVPRHYFALHPFPISELGALAERYHWRQVVDRFHANAGPRRPKDHPRDWEGYFRL